VSRRIEERGDHDVSYLQQCTLVHLRQFAFEIRHPEHRVRQPYDRVLRYVQENVTASRDLSRYLENDEGCRLFAHMLMDFPYVDHIYLGNLHLDVRHEHRGEGRRGMGSPDVPQFPQCIRLLTVEHLSLSLIMSP